MVNAYKCDLLRILEKLRLTLFLFALVFRTLAGLSLECRGFNELTSVEGGNVGKGMLLVAASRVFLICNMQS